MEISTLIRLSKNPHYKLSPEQIRQLEEHKKKEYSSKRGEVIHNHGFSTHDTSIPQEKKEDKKSKKNDKKSN